MLEYVGCFVRLVMRLSEPQKTPRDSRISRYSGDVRKKRQNASVAVRTSDLLTVLPVKCRRAPLKRTSIFVVNVSTILARTLGNFRLSCRTELRYGMLRIELKMLAMRNGFRKCVNTILVQNAILSILLLTLYVGIVEMIPAVHMSVEIDRPYWSILRD